MCHYITGLLAPDANVPEVERSAKSHLRKWDLLERHSLQGTLREGETYYLTTQGACDCGTGLGILADGTAHQPDYERKAKRLRKKGWSDAKIQRWIEEKRRGDQKIASRNADYLENPPVDVIHWTNFVTEILDAKVASYVGLMLHWYSGMIETERIRVIDRRWTQYLEFDHEYLLRAEEDVIHTFCVHKYHAT